MLVLEGGTQGELQPAILWGCLRPQHVGMSLLRPPWLLAHPSCLLRRRWWAKVLGAVGRG